jgi:site-specific DNA-methyltransferase (adenine-specific)
MKHEIIHDDCLEVMKSMADNSIDCLITDPPYGLCFMSKKWDNQVPSQEYWEECLRICKPGSFLLAFGAPRSHHHLAMAIEKAGWEITDCIMWLFGSGFPKGKSQLKPAYEPIILARKPANKCNHLNIDDCRIGESGATKRSEQAEYPKNPDGTEDRSQHWARTGHDIVELNIGRWPANIILDEEAGRLLDEQSGISRSPKETKLKKSNRDQTLNFYGTYSEENRIIQGHADLGGTSRFFYCAKTSTRERDGSTHPTMKPLRLMQYLIKLVMPKEPEAILLDPFAGSGSTILAAKQLGYNAIGIEKELEYVEIARRRIENEMLLDL